MKKFLKFMCKAAWVKWLCIGLAVIMAGGILMTLAPAEETPGKTKINRIVVSDCDSLDGWMAGDNTYSLYLDKNNLRTGVGAIGADLELGYKTYNTQMIATYLRTDPVDISSMTHFAFDIYVSDMSVMSSACLLIEVGSHEKYDVAEIRTMFFFSDLKEGWNHVEIPLEAVTDKWSGFESYSKTAEQYDSSAWKRVRFATVGTPTSEEGDTATILLDSVCFTNRPLGKKFS